jgi:diguanylate cyclase (GGDEF)-like protein
MTGLQKMFRGYEWDYGVKVRLVDTSGLVQVDSDEINIERTKLEDLNLSKDAKGDFVYQDAGDGSFVVTKYVENLKWFLVVQSNGVAESGQFANVIVVNVLLCLFVMAALVVFVQLTRRRANELENVSYKDQPTGLYNRRAFETDKDDMLNELLPEDFVYATVDINGLKTTNDTLGHAAGDELIVGAAQCLKECFGTYGRVYRIGGDEFAALLHVPPERLDALKEELAQMVGRWSGTRVQSLSVSCGYATQKEFPTQSLTELGKIADERMYADKTAYYERMNIERRRT